MDSRPRSKPAALQARCGAALLLLGLALLAPVTAPAASDGEQGSVIMISMDGTRPADVTKERLPSLVALAARGASAERLIPSFPSNTFPNHVTLVTGVAPERHGVVDNVFIDPERGTFERQEIPTWIQVEPLWSQLARRGIVSASYYWVGSEGEWPGGHAPRYWEAFSSATTEEVKVDQILAWLDLPEAERPRFITSWFHGADHEAHIHGPNAPEVTDTLRVQDRAIGRLVDGLERRALWPSTTLIVVSDHGMTTAETRVDLESKLREAGVTAQVLGIGGFASVHTEGEEGARKVVQIARELGLHAWLRTEVPSALRVGHPRFGDVVVTAEVGTAIVHENLVLAGFHGYAPEAPAMAAILIAAGREVSPGSELGEIRNVDVAPTILTLLGLPVPGWMEGRPIPFADAAR